MTVGGKGPGGQGAVPTHPNHLLRQAAASDADDLTALFLASRRTGLPYLPEIHSDRETREWMEGVVLRDCAVTAAQIDGRIVGFTALHGDELEHLYVAPDRRGQGVGSALMDAAKRSGPVRLRLWCFQRNAPARSFYEARGFTPVAFTDGSGNEEREPDVRYEWLAENGRQHSAD